MTNNESYSKEKKGIINPYVSKFGRASLKVSYSGSKLFWLVNYEASAGFVFIASDKDMRMLQHPFVTQYKKLRRFGKHSTKRDDSTWILFLCRDIHYVLNLLVKNIMNVSTKEENPCLKACMSVRADGKIKILTQRRNVNQ